MILTMILNIWWLNFIGRVSNVPDGFSQAPSNVPLPL